MSGLKGIFSLPMLGKIKRRFQSLRYYVLADAADNSITLSRQLFKHMKAHADGTDKASVFVFRVRENNTFGFMLNHPFTAENTQLCDIQYNDRYRCIGFETLCPSVGLMFYEFGLPAGCRAHLSVSVRKTADGRTYYEIDRPDINQLKQ